MFIDVLCALRADGSIRFTLNNKKRSRHARKGALFDCRQQTQEFADTGKGHLVIGHIIAGRSVDMTRALGNGGKALQVRNE